MGPSCCNCTTFALFVINSYRRLSIYLGNDGSGCRRRFGFEVTLEGIGDDIVGLWYDGIRACEFALLVWSWVLLVPYSGDEIVCDELLNLNLNVLEHRGACPFQRALLIFIKFIFILFYLIFEVIFSLRDNSQSRLYKLIASLGPRLVL